MVESNIKNTKGSILMFSNFNFSKNNMPASIFIYSHIIMLYSSALKTFFFKSLNFTNFFDRYNQIYTNYQMNK